MAKKSINRIIQELNLSSSQDWAGLMKELTEGSDRSTAILGGVYLDEQLKQLLSSFLVDDKKVLEELFSVDKPLATFSARIKMAYALGLINKIVYDDLNTIRNIRNAFAHTLHGLSFAYHDIKILAQSLVVVDKAVPNKVSDPEPRGVYVIAVLIISSYFIAKMAEITKNQQKTPEDLYIIEWKRIAYEDSKEDTD